MRYKKDEIRKVRRKVRDSNAYKEIKSVIEEKGGNVSDSLSVHLASTWGPSVDKAYSDAELNGQQATIQFVVPNEVKRASVFFFIGGNESYTKIKSFKYEEGEVEVEKGNCEYDFKRICRMPSF